MAIYYPDCPHCGNSSLFVVDVEINGISLKGIQCANRECNKYVGFYKDDTAKLTELSEAIEDLESRISDLEE